MKTRLILLSVALFLLGHLPVSARPIIAPAGMKKFNQKCPTPKKCRKLERDRDTCLLNENACEAFVAIYDDLLEYYDCSGSPASDKIKELVPAYWMCESLHFPLTYTALQKVKSLRAQRLYASPKFREGLQGPGSGPHYQASIELEAKLRKLGL